MLGIGALLQGNKEQGSRKGGLIMKKNEKETRQGVYGGHGFCIGRALLAGLAAAGVLCFSGCGSSGTLADSSKASATADAGGSGYASDDIYAGEYAEEAAAEEGVAAETDIGSVAVNRKLIKTVRMDVETEEFEVLVSKLEQKVRVLGGYIEDMNVYNGSRQSGKGIRHASMTVRIPKEQLDGFVSEVNECSNVVSKNESTEDVTLSYVDLESHKKVLLVEQDRLLDLLEKADTMEDIITIEERLSQVRYELENMESRLRTYDNLVDFSTVYLSIEEVEILTPAEELSDWEKMGNGFVQSVKNLVNGVKGFLIGLVICLPYLVFTALLVLLTALVIKVVLRKSRKKEAERLAYTYGRSETADRQMPVKEGTLFRGSVLGKNLRQEAGPQGSAQEAGSRQSAGQGVNRKQEEDGIKDMSGAAGSRDASGQPDKEHAAAGQPEEEKHASGQPGEEHAAVKQPGTGPDVSMQSGAGQAGSGEAGHFSGQGAKGRTSGRPTETGKRK